MEKKRLLLHEKILIILAVLLLLTTAALLLQMEGVFGQNTYNSSIEEPGRVPEPEPEPEPEPPPVLNPLTNLPVANEGVLQRRMLMVSLDNVLNARPHYGIFFADLVYEMPVEAGVSRLVAVFFTGEQEIIGPVRSARQYMVDIAREWQGVFVHCGGSEEALRTLSRGYVNWLNEIPQGAFFWRDRSRRAPYNVMTSSELIYAFIEHRNWDSYQIPRGFRFYSDDEWVPQNYTQADIVRVHYSQAHNNYFFNNVTGLYARYIGDTPFIDANNGAQLHVANIIVQHVNSRVIDGEGRLRIDLVGNGDAMLFTGGTVQYGRWQRADINSPTIFMNENGQEWKLNSGKTGIQIVDGRVTVNYEDTNAPPPIVEDEE
jgi:hypothetical protein